MKIRAAVLLLAGLIAGTTQATTILRVNQNAPSSSNHDGSSWANAFFQLRDALNSQAAHAATPDNPVEIWVAKGVYKPTSANDPTASFNLLSNVRILGGFAGGETTANTRLLSNMPILSGDIGQAQANPVINAQMAFNPPPLNTLDAGFNDNCYNVVTAVSVSNVVLDTLCITGGNAENVGTNSEIVIEAMGTPSVD